MTYYAIKSYLPFFQGKVIVFILFHQTSAHLYAKEKPQMSDSYLRPMRIPILTGQEAAYSTPLPGGQYFE